MSTPPLIVIFGCAVAADGQASPALVRRIGYGRAAAELHPRSPILCSGGALRGRVSEAVLIAEGLLALGVPADRLVLDEVSVDTLQNVETAVRHARDGGHPHVVLCSEGYHLPRIRILLALHKVSAQVGPAPWGPGDAPLVHWLGLCLREGLAIPHSLARLFARRLRPS